MSPGLPGASISGPQRFPAPLATGSYLKAEDRTKTGLVIMVIAFGLLWIPYVSYLGDLLAIVGVIFVWLGRGAFTPQHSRDATVGTACVFLGLLVGIMVGISFALGVVSAALTPQETSQAFVATLQSSLDLLFASSIVISALTAAGFLSLPYALADPVSRRLLWAGFALSIALTSGIVAVVAPQIHTALAQSISGATLNTGPVQALETKETLLGVVQIIPNLMFLWAYYRTRQQIFPPGAGPKVLPPLPSQSRRFD